MTARNAGLGRRLGAILYDCLLVFALLMMVATPFIAIRGGEAIEPQTDIVYRLILAVVIYAFFVGFWTRTGRTLGMQSWGLQLETPVIGAWGVESKDPCSNPRFARTMLAESRTSNDSSGFALVSVRESRSFQ